MVDKSKDPEFWAAWEKYEKIYAEEHKELDRNKLCQMKPIDNEEFFKKCDKPGTMDNVTATIFYVIIMVVGAIFNNRLLIWIVATVIWLRHIFRHELRK